MAVRERGGEMEEQKGERERERRGEGEKERGRDRGEGGHVHVQNVCVQCTGLLLPTSLQHTHLEVML